MASGQSRNPSEPQQPGEWIPALTEDFLDATTFEQLLEMDDDDEREFSKGIVWNYFEQVKAVGLIKLKASCEKIQNYGNKLDETGNHSISGEDALAKIADVLFVTKKDFRDAEIWLKRFYGEHPGKPDEAASRA